MTETRRVTLVVNGETRTAEIEPRTLLSDLLRHTFGLTGTHVGCEQGSCGACTVLLDGAPVRACLVLAPQADGATVETIEGLSGGESDLVRRAMHERHGVQCGFCTAGIVVSLTWALRDGLDEDEAVEQILGGHLCRCTGYVNIREAIGEAWAAEPPP
ncbi:MAG: (2Fe-2S)-binding protein [Actinomycetota bacterium]